MENRDNYELEDKKIRKLVENTKIEADKNLKFRIMQQINTESILAKNRSKTSISSIKSSILVLCITIILLIIGVSLVYLGFDLKGIESKSLFLNYIIPVCSILSFLAFIFALDTKIRCQKSHRKN